MSMKVVFFNTHYEMLSFVKIDAQQKYGDQFSIVKKYVYPKNFEFLNLTACSFFAHKSLWGDFYDNSVYFFVKFSKSINFSKFTYLHSYV